MGLKVTHSLVEAVNHYCAGRMGINPTPTQVERRLLFPKLLLLDFFFSQRRKGRKEVHNNIPLSDRRLQGAALVAVRHNFNILMFADGHKGRALQPPDTSR